MNESELCCWCFKCPACSVPQKCGMRGIKLWASKMISLAFGPQHFNITVHWGEIQSEVISTDKATRKITHICEIVRGNISCGQYNVLIVGMCSKISRTLWCTCLHEASQSMYCREIKFRLLTQFCCSIVIVIGLQPITMFWLVCHHYLIN